MGETELDREIGDAGGSLIVGAIATATILAAGLGALALLVAVASVLCATPLRTRPRT